MMLQRSHEQISNGKFGGRQYFLDWVRLFVFAYLIFYHTGMMFVKWKWHIESGYDSSFLKPVMLLTSNWRLDLLFIVSGVAISFMISKMSLKYFIRQRVVKLLVPLIFAIAVIVAPQSYFEALQKGVFEGSFWQFWTTKYFTFSWDERMIAPFPTFNHMWYVLYLATYTIVLLPLFAFINSKKGSALLLRLEGWLAKGTRIIWFPLVIYFLILFIYGDDNITHALIDDEYGNSIYIFELVMGVLFVRMPAIWEAFERNRYLSLTIGLVGYGALLAIFYLPNNILHFDGGEAWGKIALCVKWSWIALIIGFARHYLNFTNSVLKYGNQVVYPFYILHQTVIIVLGYYVIDWGFSAISEYLIISIGTFAICGILYETVIKNVNILRLLFGLNWHETRQQTQLSETNN